MINLQLRSYCYNSSILNFGSAKIATNVKKTSSIDDSDYPPFIKQAMKRLAKYDIEHAIIFTRDGRLIKETIGDKDQPFRSQEESEEFFKLGEKYPGWILLHNHPNHDEKGKPLPLTPADAFKAGYYDASEVIAVHPDETYSSLRCLPSEQKFSPYSTDDFKSLLYEVLEDADNYNKSGKLRDEIWRKNAKRLHVIYTNTHGFDSN